MNNVFGITGIMIKIFEVGGHDSSLTVNGFLKKYDGNIIDIHTHGMTNGNIKVVIVYKVMED
jgi:hypothetical protein